MSQTSAQNTSAGTTPASRRTEHPWQDGEFRVVPNGSRQPSSPAGSVESWQVVLNPIGSNGDFLALEIQGDVVLGSSDEDTDVPDVNLLHWNGYQNGVSRRHVMLRPSQHRLFVMDLRSTNGTYVNGLPLGVGWAYALKDGDLLSLGRLNIRVRIVSQP